MTVSWAVLGLFEHRHKPFTVRLPCGWVLTWSSPTLMSSLHFISYLSGMSVCLFCFFYPLHLKSAPSPLFPKVNVVSRADTDGGHQIAPPDKEPQPKLLTAHASQPTTWGWRWREDTWTTMTWLLNHFHPLTSCYISTPTLKRSLDNPTLSFGFL